MDSATQSPFLSAEEAAAILGIHVDHLYRLARQGEIPHQRLGKGRNAKLLIPRRAFAEKFGISPEELP